MKYTLSIGITFCVFHIISSLTEIKGIICHSCTDVSSPEHCQQTIECGQGEVCFTREFIDHYGLTGFHLGCEDNRTCELIHEAQTLFGKRQVRDVNAAPPSRCYRCCSNDKCNKNLCHASNTAMTYPSPTGTSQTMTCSRCEGVESPEHCRSTTVCGSDEVCFTREYTDNRGLRAYRLGCESRTRCTLFLDALTLFGKRQVLDPGPPEECYDCCYSNQCNLRLCQGNSGNSRTTMLPTSTTKVTTQQSSTSKVHTQAVTTCSQGFLKFEGHCYVFDMEKKNWTDARSWCSAKGGYLVSVNSQREQDFLVTQIKTNPKFSTSQGADSYWLGMELLDGTLRWSDGTDVIYTLWGGDNPNCMTAGCKAMISEFISYAWEDAGSSYPYFSVCEIES